MSTMFFAGDLVRPLNETGEGVVTGFRKDGMLLVTLQDGFEIPFLPSQLVLIRREKTEHLPTSAPVAEQSLKLPVNNVVLLVTLDAPARSEAQVSLQLANSFASSVYALLYALEGKVYTQLSSAAATAHSVVKFKSMSLKELIAFDRLFVQVVFTPREAAVIPEPRTAVIRHQVPALADPTAWPLLEAIASRGLQFKVCGEMQAQSNDKTKVEVAEKQVAVPLGEIYLTERDGYHEIDLHIEELLDDTSGMDNAAIIRHQLRIFEKCIDEARTRRLWKFVAIHGVGKGVLRDAVRSFIKEEGLKYQDASYQRYGYGATEVLMK